MSGGTPNRAGVGLFARAFVGRFPLVPVVRRKAGRAIPCYGTLIERVFCYRRWQDLIRGG